MKTIILALFMAAISSAPGWGQQTYLYDDRPKITVGGEAVVYVKPDKIIISFGIETSDLDISVAKQKNNDIMKKAVAALRDCGVPDKDIQTDYLSLQPRFRSDLAKEVFLGYFVRNTFIVTLNEAAKMEDVVTKVLQTGVNYIHNVDFQTAEFKKFREQARELALRAAREKADRMASVLGQSVGSPLQINEISSGSPWVYYSSWGGWGSARDSLMTQNAIQDLRGGSGEVLDTIALGKIAIRANVSVTFELRK
jgi:uncharacterized protein YggE